MKSRVAALRSLRFGVLPVALMVVLVVGALLLLSDSIANAEQFNHLYSTLFVVNLVILVALVTLIGVNVQRVWRQYRRGVTGSRLTVRLVALFVLLSIVPASVVYFVSYRFINRGVDSWFDVRVEEALNSSLELSRNALEVRVRELTRQTESFAQVLAETPQASIALRMSDLRAQSGAAEMSMFTGAGRVIASASTDTGKLLPDHPDDAVLMQARSGHFYAALDLIKNAGLHVRVVVQLPPAGNLREPRLLQVLFPVSERMSALTDSVQTAYARYQELSYLRGPLKFSFTVTLSLVLLLSILAAVWAAFVSAQRLVEPIRVLTIGTRAVAEGNYDKRLTSARHDELGVLVESFNEMTQKIAQARDEARSSQAEAEGERAYLKAVLGGLSSGVLTFDGQHQVRTANAAAADILAVELSDLVAATLKAIATHAPHLEPFANALQARLSGERDEWREEVTIFGPAGRRVLLCRGRFLPRAEQESLSGYMVVFDDVTALIQAERDAAWREVARRIAHEIKNPLTPIQLSAERLRHKFLAVLDPASAEVLDRSTHTIIQQVEVLKQMVKAFSEYARMPRMEPAPLDLNALVNEVIDLYRVGDNETRFIVELDARLPKIEADAMRLRQVLNNLLKNAVETTRNLPQALIIVSTQLNEDGPNPTVDLRVEDTGPGIPQELMGNLFEPYVTTKPRGTGLGLAIVKKIVDEHAGVVWVANRNEGGAGVYIRLPVTLEQKLSVHTPMRQTGSGPV